MNKWVTRLVVIPGIAVVTVGSVAALSLGGMGASVEGPTQGLLNCIKKAGLCIVRGTGFFGNVYQFKFELGGRTFTWGQEDKTYLDFRFDFKRAAAEIATPENVNPAILEKLQKQYPNERLWLIEGIQRTDKDELRSRSFVVRESLFKQMQEQADTHLVSASTLEQYWPSAQISLDLRSATYTPKSEKEMEAVDAYIADGIARNKVSGRALVRRTYGEKPKQ